MQAVSHAITPSVLAVYLGFFSDGRCLSEFSLDDPDVVDSLVWSQAFECVTKSPVHLLKGLLLCGNAQILRVHETPCVGMNRLVICVYC